jgi:DNA-binding transcriptional LysR family regulator
MRWLRIMATSLCVMEMPSPVDRSRVNPLSTRAETGNASTAHHQNRLHAGGSKLAAANGDGLDADLAAGMELRQLRYFVTLAEELHFGRAAEREHIVQSALSQQVQRLERELGVRLLERSTHRVALTAAGVAFLVEARQILAHVPLGVLVPTAHPFADLDGVSAAALAREPLLLAEDARAPEFNQFTIEMCRAAGFTPTVYRGTVESIRAAAALVAQGRCLYCVPSSCIAALPGTVWRPLTEPASDYPWSVLWRAADDSGHVRAVVSCAQAMSKRLGWLTTADQTALGGGHMDYRAG